jgi:hypothetical protein
MGPDPKLAWFKGLEGMTADRLHQIKALVVSWWNESYAPADTPAVVNEPPKMTV